MGLRFRVAVGRGVTREKTIPVIDLFAGPGGLGEGFSSLRSGRGNRPFRITLSIEKDPRAHATLRLRSFVRTFGDAPPAAYYDALRRTDEPLSARVSSLFDEYSLQASHADSEAWNAELGRVDPELLASRIATATEGSHAWVLLGGPPCQAYSLAGRSRNKGKADYEPAKAKREFL